MKGKRLYLDPPFTTYIKLNPKGVKLKKTKKKKHQKNKNKKESKNIIQVES